MPPIVSEFRALPAEERVRAIERYRARIRTACADERRSVPPSRKRYAAAIDSAQAQLLGDIKRLVRQSTKPEKSGSAKPTKQLRGLTIGSTKQTPPTHKKPRQPAKQKSSASKPKAARPSSRTLPGMHVKATTRNGVLHASWGQNEEADRWLVVIVRKKRTGQKVVQRLMLDAETLAFHTADIDLARGPYGVRVFALRNRKPLARGAVDGIVDPTAAPIAEQPPAATNRMPKRRSSARSASKKATATRQKAKKVKKAGQTGLAKSKICLDGPRWKPKRRCPCPRCRAAAKRKATSAGVRAAMRSSGPTGRPRATFWRGR
jgi:hypothetical protein